MSFIKLCMFKKIILQYIGLYIELVEVKILFHLKM